MQRSSHQELSGKSLCLYGKCNRETQCELVNVMDELEKCELLSTDGSHPMETEPAPGWSCLKTPNMGFCSAAKSNQGELPCSVLGKSKSTPARSCLQLVTRCSCYAVKSGLYWIQGSAASVQMFCDMVTDGGGWTKVGNADTMSGSYPDPNSYLSNDVNLLDRASSGFFRLSTIGLKELRLLIEFTQVRVFCFKPSVKRTVHIVTTKSALGYAVVDYMTGVNNNQPVACGSYTKLADDTSILSDRCDQWALLSWSAPNVTPNDRLYDHTAFVVNYFHIIPGVNGYYLCDDMSAETQGTWSYYVR